MDELIKLLSAKLGLNPEQAKTAVETVVNFLKQKLPAPVAAQIDGLLAGNIADKAKDLGGMLNLK